MINSLVRYFKLVRRKSLFRQRLYRKSFNLGSNKKYWKKKCSELQNTENHATYIFMSSVFWWISRREASRL